MLIYRAKNLVNGKVYIGLTIRETPEYRLRCHALSKWPFGKAFRKYGRANFEITIVARAKSREDLSRKEQHWIKKSNSLAPYGYNLTTGGEGSYTRHASTIKKLKKSLKKRDTPAFRKKMAACSRGKSPSLETRKKISDSLKGHVPWNKGKKLGPLSKAQKKKLSIALLGKNKGNKRPDLAVNARKWAASLEYVNPMKGRKRPDLVKRNRENTGRKFSKEHIEKIKIAQQLRRERERNP